MVEILKLIQKNIIHLSVLVSSLIILNTIQVIAVNINFIGYINLLNYQYYLIILLISGSIIIIILQIMQLQYSQNNVQDSDNIFRKVLENKIVYSIQNFDIDLKQNLESLIDFKTPLHLLKYIVDNPASFHEDFTILISYLIQLMVYDNVQIEEREYLIESISTEKRKIIGNQIDNNSFDIFKSKIKNIIDIYRKYVIYLNLEDKNTQIYNYQNLKHMLDKLNVKLIELKRNKIENYKFNSDILNLKSFDRYNNVYLSNECKISNKSQEPQFFKSIYHNFVNEYYIKKDQNIEIDNFISKMQQSDVSNSLNLKYQKINSTKKIWNQIEDMMNINISNENNSENIYYCQKNQKDQQLNMKTTIAEDKNENTIYSKLNRKYAEASEFNKPWFYFLIKDIKRLSIVFKSTQDLSLFIKLIERVFGSEFEKEKNMSKINYLVKIREIKNGFVNESNTSNSQKDLKIIFDIFSNEVELGFTIEVQCHVNEQIKWKNAEHIIYDITRLENEIINSNLKYDKYLWQESNSRTIIQYIIIVLLFLSAITIMTVIIYTIIYQQNNINQIGCLKGKKICFEYCTNIIFYSNNNQIYDQINLCSNYFIEFNQNLNLREKLFFCQKQNFISDDKFKNLCNNQLKDSKFGFIEGFDIGTYIPNQYFNYQNNSNLNSIMKRIKDFDSIYSSFDSQIILYNDHPIDQILNNSKYIHEKIIDVLNNQSINSINMLQERLCITYNDSNLYCSVSSNRQIDFFEFYGLICMIQISNKMFCFNHTISDYKKYPINMLLNVQKVIISSLQTCIIDTWNELKCEGQESLPNYIKFDNLIVSGNDILFCVIKIDYQIVCYGRNDFGLQDFNNDFKQIQVEISDRTSCAITTQSVLQCIGQYDSDFVTNANIIGTISLSVWNNSIGIVNNNGEIKISIIGIDNYRLFELRSNSYKFISVQVKDNKNLDKFDKFQCGILETNNVICVQDVDGFLENFIEESLGLYALKVLQSIYQSYYLYLDDLEQSVAQINKNLDARQFEDIEDVSLEFEYNVSNYKSFQIDNHWIQIEQNQQDFILYHNKQEQIDNDNDYVRTFQIDQDYDQYCIDKTLFQQSNNNILQSLNYLTDNLNTELQISDSQIIDIVCSEKGFCAYSKDQSLYCNYIGLNIDSKDLNIKNVQKYILNEYYLCIIYFDFKLQCQGEINDSQNDFKFINS